MSFKCHTELNYLFTVSLIFQFHGTELVKGLALEFPRNNTICVKTKAFKKMNKLRLLQLSGVELVLNIFQEILGGCIDMGFHQLTFMQNLSKKVWFPSN
jgi:hypothetical protein